MNEYHIRAIKRGFSVGFVFSLIIIIYMGYTSDDGIKLINTIKELFMFTVILGTAFGFVFFGSIEKEEDDRDE
jgi:hypothetical protein